MGRADISAGAAFKAVHHVVLGGEVEPLRLDRVAEQTGDQVHRAALHTAPAADAAGRTVIHRKLHRQQQDAGGVLGHRHLKGFLREAHHRPAENQLARLGGHTARELDRLDHRSTDFQQPVARIFHHFAGYGGHAFNQRDAAADRVGHRGGGADILDHAPGIHRQAAGRNFPAGDRHDQLLFGPLRILHFESCDLDAEFGGPATERFDRIDLVGLDADIDVLHIQDFR